MKSIKKRKAHKRNDSWLKHVVETEFENAGLTEKQLFMAKSFWLEGKSPSDIADERNVEPSTVCISLKASQEKILKLRERKIAMGKSDIDAGKNQTISTMPTRELKIILGFFRQSARMLEETCNNIKTLAEQVEKLITENGAAKNVAKKDGETSESAEEEVSGQPPEIGKPPPVEKVEVIKKTSNVTPEPTDEDPDEAEIEIPVMGNLEDLGITIDLLSKDEPTEEYLAEIEASSADTEPDNLDEYAIALAQIRNKRGGTGKKIKGGNGDRSDTVKIFLNEMGKIPLLSREEEIKLAKEIEAANANLKATKADEIETAEAKTANIKLAKNKIELVRNKMVEANLRLVISIAKKYLGRGMQFKDLIQEGNIGLMKAADKFEYQRGFKFSTYATWWVRQAITRTISNKVRTIRIPVHMVETINKVIRTSRYLTQELGREPHPEEIANRMEYPLEKILKVLRIVKEPLSLETPVGSDEGEKASFLGEFIEDPGAISPQEANVNSDLAEKIRFVLSTLTLREEKVIRLRFGISENNDIPTDDSLKQYRKQNRQKTNIPSAV